jgi:hypothetical protein
MNTRSKNSKKMIKTYSPRNGQRNLSAKQKKKYLLNFKNKLNNPKIKFRNSMKFSFKCLKQSSKLIIIRPFTYYMKFISRIIYHNEIQTKQILKRYKDELNVLTVNSSRNNIAIKNAFIQFVVYDSLKWAKGKIREELGQFGVCMEHEQIKALMLKEEETLKEQSNKIIEEGKKKKQKKAEKKKPEEVFLNLDELEKREYLNLPIHKKHLTGKVIKFK